MAHITPNSHGGDVSFDNLIMLCPTCHIRYETTTSDENINLTRRWKNDRLREIDQRFQLKCDTLDQLGDIVIPLLKRNYALFQHYGPDPSNISEQRTQEQWDQVCPDIIANNAKLQAVLNANFSLFQNQDPETITTFDLHVNEFARTRDRSDSTRTVLFPHRLLHIFGLAGTTSDAPSIGAFGHNEAPSPVRRNEIDFLLNWLTKNGISHTVPDPTNPTHVLANDRFNLKLIDRYTISVADMYELVLNPGDIVINVYVWNYGSYTTEAKNFADSIGCHLFTKQEFYRFAHLNIKCAI